ncbi:hypothetical protein C8F01DRAFT_1259480 [Mycena amicta]|nr:hypothetical protein C8F01DRAFT_1259480 [Mycena amicta]
MQELKTHRPHANPITWTKTFTSTVSLRIKLSNLVISTRIQPEVGLLWPLLAWRLDEAWSKASIDWCLTTALRSSNALQWTATMCLKAHEPNWRPFCARIRAHPTRSPFCIGIYRAPGSDPESKNEMKMFMDATTSSSLSASHNLMKLNVLQKSETIKAVRFSKGGYDRPGDRRGKGRLYFLEFSSSASRTMLASSPPNRRLERQRDVPWNLSLQEYHLDVDEYPQEDEDLADESEKLSAASERHIVVLQLEAHYLLLASLVQEGATKAHYLRPYFFFECNHGRQTLLVDGLKAALARPDIDPSVASL